MPRFTPLQVWAASLKVSELVPVIVSARALPAWSCSFHSAKERRLKICLQEDTEISISSVQSQHRQICISHFPMKGKCLAEGTRRACWEDLCGLQVCQLRSWQPLSIPPQISSLSSIISVSSLVIQWLRSVAVTGTCNDQQKKLSLKT